MFRLFILLLWSSSLAAAGSFHVCTVANSLERGTVKYLFSSAQKQAIALNIIGYGMPYYGNGTKLLRMEEAIADLPDDDIILFVDAFDVMFLKNKEELLKTFLSMEVPLVFATEKSCFPNPKYRKHFPQHCHFPYINSGCYMGYVGVLKKMYREMNYNIHSGEQGQITKYYIRKQRFALDHECRLFLCLHRVTEDELELKEDGSVYCRLTDSFPGVLHANGGVFELLEQIYQKIILE